MSVVELWPVLELRPDHPASEPIFMRDACTIRGIARYMMKDGFGLYPLIVTRNGYIINGYLRWRAAILAGISKVPVMYMDGYDDNYIRGIIEFNST
jgi:hypothetical protein